MKPSIFTRILVLLAVVMMLSSCSSLRQVTWTYEPPENFSIVQAVGYAQISLQNGKDDTERLLRAMKVSKLDAFQELTEQVYGRRMEAGSTVKELVLNNEHMNSQILGIIRGANVVRSYQIDDTYVTEMELDFTEVYRITMSMAPTRHLDSQKIIHF